MYQFDLKKFVPYQLDIYSIETALIISTLSSRGTAPLSAPLSAPPLAGWAGTVSSFDIFTKLQGLFLQSMSASLCSSLPAMVAGMGDDGQEGAVRM